MKLKYAAEILRVNVLTLKRKIKPGLLKATMINRHWEVTQEALNDYLKTYDSDSR